MIVQCPHCGKPVAVSGLGRKRLNVPLNIICDALQAHKNVKTVAQQLNCSSGYIFKILKENRLTLKDVIKK